VTEVVIRPTQRTARKGCLGADHSHSHGEYHRFELVRRVKELARFITQCEQRDFMLEDLDLGILVRKLLRRDNFRSIDDLRTQVLALLDYFNRTVAKPLLMDLPGTATSCLTRRSRPDQGRAVLGSSPRRFAIASISS
jgi:hypothetical protein